jgi:hypothetical protein
MMHGVAVSGLQTAGLELSYVSALKSPVCRKDRNHISVAGKVHKSFMWIWVSVSALNIVIQS